MCDPAAVKAITGSTLEDSALQPFIDAAECILARVSDCTTAAGISESCLEQACAFLSAHLLTLSTVGQADGQGVKKRETFENYTVEYLVGSYSGTGVMSTPYGTSANAITGGCLQNADKAPMQVCFFG